MNRRCSSAAAFDSFVRQRSLQISWRLWRPTCYVAQLRFVTLVILSCISDIRSEFLVYQEHTTLKRINSSRYWSSRMSEGQHHKIFAGDKLRNVTFSKLCEDGSFIDQSQEEEERQLQRRNEEVRNSNTARNASFMTAEKGRRKSICTNGQSAERKYLDSNCIACIFGRICIWELLVFVQANALNPWHCALKYRSLHYT